MPKPLTAIPMSSFPGHLRRARGAKSKTKAAEEAGVNRITYLRAERGDSLHVDAYLALLAWAARQGKQR